MEYKQLKQIIEDAAKKAGIMEYEVYYTEDRGMDVSVFQSEIKEFSSAESRGRLLPLPRGRKNRLCFH